MATIPSIAAPPAGGADHPPVANQPDQGWAISCDFDGTITSNDLVQSMLARFATAEWREIEAEWEAGRIGARTCLELQTRLIRVFEPELAAWVDEQPVDPDTAGFFADCGRLGLDVRILSDGYDWLIRRVMRRLGLSHIPIVANRLTYAGDGRWTVEFANQRAGCDAGTCKCAAVSQAHRRIHIGDGRSDVCVSDVAELVFAKNGLLRSRNTRGLPSVPFTSFAEIRAQLPNLPGQRRLGAVQKVPA